MEPSDARRLIETTSYETANQYLRFGWRMVNQYVVEATADRPAEIHYVLAAVRSLADAKEIVERTDAAGVNAYLAAGWRLIDKYLTGSDDPDKRHETLHFVLAWQNDEPPVHPALPTPAEQSAPAAIPTAATNNGRRAAAANRGKRATRLPRSK